MNAAERKEIERCRELAETIWQSDGGEDVSSEIADLKDALARLLSTPPRNCDEGTAEEQYERLHRFCISHECRSCPCKTDRNNGACSIVRTQMPYKEGATK